MNISHRDIPFLHPLAEEILNENGETCYNSWVVASISIFAFISQPENTKSKQTIFEFASLSPGMTAQKISELIKRVKNLEQDAIRELQTHIAEGFEVFAYRTKGLIR